MKKLSWLIFIIVIMGVIFANASKLGKLTSDKDFLNFFAKLTFDQAYYLKTYPDVAKLNISPFEHYSQTGWMEGKNPNKDFDNDLYRRLYLASFRSSAQDLNPLQHSIRCKLRLQTCYTHPTQLKKARPLKDAKYYLALSSMFRNDGSYLKEWIEFYKLMGVEHFYLFNNLSTDNYKQVLAPYIKDGSVELFDAPIEAKNFNEFEKLTYDIYEQAAEKSKDQAEWLIMVDSDEFLYPVKADNLVEVLKKYDDYATVTVNWKLFGSGEVEQIPTDKLLIETLLSSASENASIMGKSIVKPRYVEAFMSTHFPKLKKGYAQVSENYEYFYGHFTPIASSNFMVINHYTFRDWDYFYSTKVARIHVGGNKSDLKCQLRAKFCFHQEESNSHSSKYMSH